MAAAVDRPEYLEMDDLFYATRQQVWVMGVLEHPLERYWVLWDAMHLEVRDDGLDVLAERVATVSGEKKTELPAGT